MIDSRRPARRESPRTVRSKFGRRRTAVPDHGSVSGCPPPWTGFWCGRTCLPGVHGNHGVRCASSISHPPDGFDQSRLDARPASGSLCIIPDPPQHNIESGFRHCPEVSEPAANNSVRASPMVTQNHVQYSPTPKRRSLRHSPRSHKVQYLYLQLFQPPVFVRFRPASSHWGGVDLLGTQLQAPA